jgi:hypothetical protein
MRRKIMVKQYVMNEEKNYMYVRRATEAWARVECTFDL